MVSNFTRGAVGLTAAMLTACAAASADPGHLVIVGGALDDGNSAVYEALLSALPDRETDHIAIISAASGSPASSAAHMVEVLGRYGIPAGRIDWVQLAVIDDDSTPDVDESTWAGRASDPEEIARVAGAGGIWFTGGDQARLTDTLLMADGSDTPLLAMLRQRLSQGSVIGGSSAGAAIMSTVMIARGDSLTALLDDPLTADVDASRMESGALVTTTGLGFFPFGVVDQHFDRRARLGRLARTLAVSGETQGFGMDEDTALVVDLANQTLTALGSGSVTWLDATRLEADAANGRFQALGLRLSVLTGGDTVGIESRSVALPEYKAATIGHEYFDHSAVNGGGIAIGNNRLDSLLGEDLVDNSTVSRLERVSFLTDGRGVMYVFTQDGSSAGYWGHDPDGRERYSIINIAFDIVPVDVAITEAASLSGQE